MTATCQAYNPQTCFLHHAGSLPFTGIDVATIIIVAMVLVLLGILLHGIRHMR
jgi:hypothetical protein